MLFILLLLCHWAADYTQLSTPKMLAAKRFGKPVTPIFRHAMRHAFLVLLALLFFGVKDKVSFLCFAFMLITHFAIDVWKGRMNVWFPSLQSPTNVYHWWVFGADQTLHMAVLFGIYQYAQ